MRRSIIAASLAALIASGGLALAGYSGALGTMAPQNSNAVAVTGGTVDGTTLGATTPAALTGTFVKGGGSNANLSTNGGILSALQNTGQFALGWNYTNGAGETDLFVNKAGGSAGGFNAYAYGNTGTVNPLWSATAVSFTTPAALTVGTGLNLTKLAAAPTTAPGAGLAQLFVVAGTNSGTCKLQMLAGTSATAVTIADNVGAGC